MQTASVESVKSEGDLLRFLARRGQFFDDFVAMAEQIRSGAAMLEEMLAPEQADLGQGRRDQGGRAQVRLPDPRDHPAPAPHLRHAARPRRHPRRWRDRSTTSWTPSTRRRRSSASTRSSASGRTRASWRASSRPRPRDGEGDEGARARTAWPSARSRSTGSRTRPDRVHQAARPPLFEEERDPIAIIKWKEILDFLEEATDRCEDVANVLEGVVVKHA